MIPKCVLVVDDDLHNLALLGEILEETGYRIEVANDGLEAVAKLKLGIDLVLLDLVMPGMDGFEVCRRIRADARYQGLPIIMITGFSSREHHVAALRAGAQDFVGRPFDPTELRLKVHTQLRLREAEGLLQERQVACEDAVLARTASLRSAIFEAVEAQREAWQAHLDSIHRLVLACEFKDYDTAAHVQRIAEYCTLLAEELGLSPGEVELVRHASPMHDVGKIGIPDTILLKPGPLTFEERRVMEQHAEIGARILGGSASRLLQAGEVIAWSHHERWDGTGYPRRLAGEDIPLWGRICAVADFFDALTSHRIYRRALTIDETLERMSEARETHFDPRLLDLFLGAADKVRAIHEGLRGTAPAPIARETERVVLPSLPPEPSSSEQPLELHLRAAVESAPSGLLMIDAGGSIVLVNREVERLFGYSRDELLGEPVERLVPDRFRGRHPEFRTAFFAAPSTRAMGAGRELFGLCKDGTEVPVDIGLTPVATPAGLFVISSIVDVSARKQAEEERRHLEARLRQAHKLEAVGTMAGGIAHDFNNILGAILGYSELATEHLAPDSRPAADLRQVLKAADRGKQLVERILTFSRRQEARREPLDLGRTVTEVLELMRATTSTPVDLRDRIDPTTPKVIADTTSVHQVVMNLVTNATQAVSTGGLVEVAVEPVYVRDHVARSHPDLHEGPYAILTVRDSGVGMDATTMERAFEPFFTTKPPGSGTGLGLAVVHGILRDHEGAVLLESEPGQGTTVRCYFPTPEGVSSPSREVASDIPRGSGEQILYVDDEEALTLIGERRLIALGYQVSVFTDPALALETFRADPHRFQLVVTDYLMPRMTGLDLARQIVDLRPEIRIIVLTGFLDEPAGEGQRLLQVQRILKKPLTMLDLARAVRGVLDA